MPKLERKKALAFKIETTAGTDSVPTPAANAALVRNFVWNPMEMTLEERDFVRAYLGNSESIAVAKWGTMEFDIEMAGAGTAGNAPKWGPLLRGCGFAETLDPGVDAVYTPVSEGFESLSLYGHLDGLLHKGVYSMGNVRVSTDANKIPFFRFSYRGLYLPVSDAAAWTPDYTGWVKPIAVNKANTTGSLHGVAAKIEALSLDMKNQVEYRNLINEESVNITDRKPDGSISFEATTVATKDWLATILATGTGALEIVHGTAPGNIVELDAPGVQLVEPRYVNSQGVMMLQSNLRLVPGVSGNDELVITVR